MFRILLPGLLLTGALSAACGAERGGTRTTQPAPAPDVSWRWLDGTQPEGSLSALRGRVVLLEFWRTCCSAAGGAASPRSTAAQSIEPPFALVPVEKAVEANWTHGIDALTKGDWQKKTIIQELQKLFNH